MFDRHPSHGFRVSASDVVILILAGVVTPIAWTWFASYALLLPVTLGHFFLFCNVFRVRRGVELVWAASFALNFTLWYAAGAFSWIGLLAVQAPVTIGLLVLEVRRLGYHGVFSRPDKDPA